MDAQVTIFCRSALDSGLWRRLAVKNNNNNNNEAGEVGPPLRDRAVKLLRD